MSLFIKFRERNKTNILNNYLRIKINFHIIISTVLPSESIMKHIV